MEVTGLGIRDVILPGEMSGTCSATFKVTEAKKAAETGPRRSLRDRRTPHEILFIVLCKPTPSSRGA